MIRCIGAFVVATVLASACSPDQPAGPAETPNDSTFPPTRPHLPRAIVSNPVASSSQAGAGLAALDGTSNDRTVFVSMSPGEFGNAQTVRLLNVRTRDSARANVINGGFDPVSMAARTGDTIEVRVQPKQPTADSVFIVVVPPSQRPRVVRTDPPDGKRDVPLSAAMAIVFSEPMDTASVSGGVRLYRGSTPVDGTVTAADAARTRYMFVPSAPLLLETTYSLVITSALDSDGEGVPTVSVAFTTSQLPESAPGGRIVFVSTRSGAPQIYTTSSDGASITQLTSAPADYRRPVWSPDASRIAYNVGADTGRIHVMNADGTGAVALADGSDPAWSPDGARIAFVRAFRLYVMNADGTNVQQLATPPGVWTMSPAWSPDGLRVAYTRTANPDDTPWEVYIMTLDGLQSEKLTLHPGGPYTHAAECRPVWAPDGQRIALWSYQAGLATVPSIPGSYVPTTVLFASSFQLGCGTNPAWSPDGRYLAFARSPTGIPGTSRIYVVHATQVNEPSLLLTPGSGADYDPNWSRR